MDANPLEIKLCLKFCPYYKPGKNEELACKGYTVVERLIQSGRRIDFEKYGLEFDNTDQEAVRQRMCMACAFHEQDCDFMLDRTAPPCGGFALVMQLLGSGVMTVEDVE